MTGGPGEIYIKNKICELAYFDGYEQGINGVTAVAHVFRNRIQAGWYGGDWIQLLSALQGKDRSFSANLAPYPTKLPDPRERTFQAILQDIDGIFSGYALDRVTCVPRSESILAVAPPAVLYYARLDQIDNPEFLENIVRRPDVHSRLAQVGLLYFFS